MLDFPQWKILSIVTVCLFFAFAALPNILTSEHIASLPDPLPKDKVNLGLDLRGGSHLLLRVDFDVYLKEHFEMTRDEVRSVLRENKIGYRQLLAKGDRVSVEIREDTVDGETDIEALIRDINPDVQMEREAGKLTLSYEQKALDAMKLKLLEQSIEIINRRINETGTKEPTIQRQGNDRVLVQVPGVENPEELKRLLGKTAKMTFHLVNETVTPEQLQRGIVPPGTRIVPSADPQEQARRGGQGTYPIFSRVALSGELLTNANASFDRGQPIVEFQFNALGARKFGEITQASVGKRFAVVLDNKVITAPVIRSAILGGRGMIEGSFTVDSANELAILLRAGALPAPLTVIEERSVGPSLGADSVVAGEKAVLIAIAAVMIYMLISYGLFGIFSNIALAINIVIILGVLSLLQATLTLPGIAGIVLTMGMAVDANVLIFERIREEIRNGKSVMASIEHGFRTAFGTIIDSNLTTLIAALVLFAFGSGTIKGFAVTLSIGIASSMFSAILLTRMMVAVWFHRTRPKAVPI